MIRMFCLAALAAAVVMGLVIWLTPTADVAVAFYGDKLRGILFSGLLTVGSFLLSLKVFIVVKFKENVFDSAGYKKLLEEKRKINHKITHYGPVRNLSKLLFVAIASALTASFLQISIGLLPVWWAMFICIATASFSAILLLQVLWLIRKIIKEWLDFSEETSMPATDSTMGNSSK